ncbi:serine hydrolase domain-containing protein [Psychroflexus aestuariivivens]|uniref:serine hydrolase domain-containing protein n=1 Tax=Psychroflexus aestuariivivens TaxID=1795040 RepID=UPI001300B5B7|nr:serine hydrolase domain-containing protein [Psychroflexus aestuariivivens]
MLLDSLNVPSVSIAIGVDNKIVWSEAIGYADLDKKINATPKTTYRIGSTSKAVTSVAIMKLVQQNKLNLDESVSNLLPDYPVKKWKFTTRQLLSHTAGFPDYEDLSISGGFYTLLNFKQFHTVEEGLVVFKDVPLLFKPGDRFRYNSFDVVLASRVIEKISNQDFLGYLENNLFQTLKMKHTYGDHFVKEPEYEAEFYQTSSGNKYRRWHTFGVLHPDQNLSYKWAGGGLLSTPGDLVKMGNALLNDTTFVNTRVRNAFFEPQRLSNGEINEQKYALGWRSYYDYASQHLLGEETPVWMVHHGGVSKGSMNLLCLFPNEGVVIDVAINGRQKEFDFSPFWYQVMDLVQPFLVKEYKAVQ